MKEKEYLSVAIIFAIITIVYACLSAQDKPEQSYEEPVSSVENEIEEKEKIEDTKDVEEEIREVKADEKEKKENIQVNKKEESEKPGEIEEEKAEEPEEKDTEIKSDVKETGPTGIIAFYTYSARRDGEFGYEIQTVSINPDTGTTKEIAHFRFEGVVKEADESYIAWTGGGEPLPPISRGTYRYVNLGRPDITANFRHLFSPDFSKMAAVKIFRGNSATHMGWIDSDGIFFDLTESLGEVPKNDFEDPRHFWVVGYTLDGTFEYGETYYKKSIYEREMSDGFNTYYVTPDNLKQSFEGDPFISEYLYNVDVSSEGYEAIKWFVRDDLHLSDWIDETHCIANDRETSFIVDVATHEKTEYIPGDSRENWSGVVSPDGSKIAFLSMPAQGTEAPNIYVTSVNGGNPEQIKCDLELQRPESSNYGIFLLDWR